ncbi:putative endonuclease lcl3 [Phlyctochytrium bullatum]|nr:putative endonuclease lcl3 [Phlyctochytrium bullatum]
MPTLAPLAAIPAVLHHLATQALGLLKTFLSLFARLTSFWLRMMAADGVGVDDDGLWDNNEGDETTGVQPPDTEDRDRDGDWREHGGTSWRMGGAETAAWVGDAMTWARDRAAKAVETIGEAVARTEALAGAAGRLRREAGEWVLGMTERVGQWWEDSWWMEAWDTGEVTEWLVVLVLLVVGAAVVWGLWGVIRALGGMARRRKGDIAEDRTRLDTTPARKPSTGSATPSVSRAQPFAYDEWDSDDTSMLRTPSRPRDAGWWKFGGAGERVGAPSARRVLFPAPTPMRRWTLWPTGLVRAWGKRDPVPETAAEVPWTWFRERKRLRGLVVRVGDADGFRVVAEGSRGYRDYVGDAHGVPRVVPGRVAMTPVSKRRVDSISVRLAGVDAPECAHWGAPGQPFAKEAQQFLANLILGKMVTITLLRMDQYGRVVASAEIDDVPGASSLDAALPLPTSKKPWSFFSGITATASHAGPRDVSLLMLEAGLAVVFEGMGAEYGEDRDRAYARFKKAEAEAKRRRVGMWSRLGAASGGGGAEDVFGASAASTSGSGWDETQMGFDSPAMYKRRLRSRPVGKDD